MIDVTYLATALQTARLVPALSSAQVTTHKREVGGSMEDRSSQVKNGRDANPDRRISASQPYRTPRLKIMGPVAVVIRGAYSYTWQDKHSSDFYISGE